MRDVQVGGGEKRFIGEIVNTRVDESVLDEDGRVDFARMRRSSTIPPAASTAW